MEHPLRVLIVDDRQPDAELSARHIGLGGYPCTWRRVETETQFRAELREFAPDLILSDFSLPQYDGLSALEVAVAEAPRTPFIFVSGTIGEKRATEALTRGAAGYVPKNNLAQLGPAVARALAEPTVTAHGGAPAERIRRLGGALRMLSGMRAAAINIHTRTALLEEACRIVFASKLYKHCSITLINPHTQTGHAVASAGMGAALPRGSVVSLPLMIGSSTMGALSVGVDQRAHISEQELLLLQSVAAQISFTLHALANETIVRQVSPLDPLTGLPKRQFFAEHLAHFLSLPLEGDAIPTVMLFDIEHLQDVNDAYGRHAGDRLLQDVAARLKRRFGGGHDLAYLGGGTFGAVFTEHRLASKRQSPPTAVFGHPFSISGHAVLVTVRCGLASFPMHGRDAEALLLHAESALNQTRQPASPSHSVSIAHSLDSRRSGLEQRLRVALKEQQFMLRYQPLIERKTGRVAAVEALLRWRDPQHGVILPGVFVPALESTGLIVPVGEWVLARAARDCAHWRRMGLPPIRVAVNVSPVELGRAGFAEYFLDSLRTAGSSGGIDIEITESAMFDDSDSLRETLQLLREEGVRTAIDDFGMGYSSLGRLTELPLDTLKIDRSFVSPLSRQPQSQAVVSTIIALAKAYGLQTVAEGVETTEQLEVLNALGCEHSQGYLHSPPVSAEELELLIASSVVLPTS